MFYSGPLPIPWGKVKMNGVMLGFCSGYLMADDLSILDKEGRKEVYTITFLSSDEIKREILRKYLFEASEIDSV